MKIYFCIRRKYSNTGNKVDDENTVASASLFTDIQSSINEEWTLLAAPPVHSVFRDDRELHDIGRSFAENDGRFRRTVILTWQKLANFDR